MTRTILDKNSQVVGESDVVFEQHRHVKLEFLLGFYRASAGSYFVGWVLGVVWHVKEFLETYYERLSCDTYDTSVIKKRFLSTLSR